MKTLDLHETTSPELALIFVPRHSMLEPYLIKSLKLLRSPGGNFESVSPRELFSTILRPHLLYDSCVNIFGKVPAYCKVSFFECRNGCVSFDLCAVFTNRP